MYSVNQRDFFENEKLIYSLVKHPNILGYHGHYEIEQDQDDQDQVAMVPRLHQPQLVLVFDLATCNLPDYLRATRNLTPLTALHISQGVARGLSHLHNLNDTQWNLGQKQHQHHQDKVLCSAIVAHRLALCCLGDF